LALRPLRAGEVVEGLDSIGPQRQRSAVAGNRFFEPAELLERGSEIAVQFDSVRPNPQRFFEIGDRPLRLTEILPCVA